MDASRCDRGRDDDTRTPAPPHDRRIGAPLTPKPIWLQSARLRVALAARRARRADRDDAVAARPDGERRHRRLLGEDRCRSAACRPDGRRSIRRAARHCCARQSPEKGEPRVTTFSTRSGRTLATSRAKTPPRLQPTRITLPPVAERLDPLGDPLARVRGLTPRVQPHAPAGDPIAGRGERALQAQGGAVVGDEAGDHHQLRPVRRAARGEPAEAP